MVKIRYYTRPNILIKSITRKCKLCLGLFRAYDTEDKFCYKCKSKDKDMIKKQQECLEKYGVVVKDSVDKSCETNKK